MSDPVPMQPIARDADGVVRFRRNAIVSYLLESGKADLNQLAFMVAKGTFPIDDVEQFWQMLGYSVSGFGDLDFVRPETVAKADEIAEQIPA